MIPLHPNISLTLSLSGLLSGPAERGGFQAIFNLPRKPGLSRLGTSMVDCASTEECAPVGVPGCTVDRGDVGPHWCLSRPNITRASVLPNYFPSCMIYSSCMICSENENMNIGIPSQDISFCTVEHRKRKGR